MKLQNFFRMQQAMEFKIKSSMKESYCYEKRSIKRQ